MQVLARYNPPRSGVPILEPTVPMAPALGEVSSGMHPLVLAALAFGATWLVLHLTRKG